MKKYKLIVMSFDGEYKTEHPEFESVESAWEYSNNLGSKWFFYPFHFIVTASGKTIADSPDMLSRFNGKRVKIVAKEFHDLSVLPEMEGAGVEEFVMALA